MEEKTTLKITITSIQHKHTHRSQPSRTSHTIISKQFIQSVSTSFLFHRVINPMWIEMKTKIMDVSLTLTSFCMWCVLFIFNVCEEIGHTHSHTYIHAYMHALYTLLMEAYTRELIEAYVCYAVYIYTYMKADYGCCCCCFITFEFRIIFSPCSVKCVYVCVRVSKEKKNTWQPWYIWCMADKNFHLYLFEFIFIFLG